MNLFTSLAAALWYITEYKITKQKYLGAKEKRYFQNSSQKCSSKTFSLFCVLTSRTTIRVMHHFGETPFLKATAVVKSSCRAHFSRRLRSAFAYELSKCCSEELKWWKTAVGRLASAAFWSDMWAHKTFWGAILSLQPPSPSVRYPQRRNCSPVLKHQNRCEGLHHFSRPPRGLFLSDHKAKMGPMYHRYGNWRIVPPWGGGKCDKILTRWGVKWWFIHHRGGGKGK